MIDDGEDLVAKLLNSLTGGLVDLSGGSPKFDIGALGAFGDQIEGVLNKFEIDFNGFVENFTADYVAFKDNFAGDLSDLINLRPRSLPSFSGILQIGSKNPSTQFSPKLKLALWNKLSAAFPSYLYNGVPVPGLPFGKSFIETYPTCCDFPVRNFLPAISVAFGKAPSFSDIRASKFTMDDLFTPNFGPSLSLNLLNKIKSVPSLQIEFSRFDIIDIVSGLPMDSITKELFDVNAYLPGEASPALVQTSHLSRVTLTRTLCRVDCRDSSSAEAFSINGSGSTWLPILQHPRSPVSILRPDCNFLWIIHEEGIDH